MKKFLFIFTLLFATSSIAHEMVPTYPKWEPSGLYPGVVKTTIEIFNKRSDVEYYEIAVFDKDWQPIYFVADYKVIRLKYLASASIDIYISTNNRDSAEYICSRSKIQKDNDIRTAVSSKICSRFKQMKRVVTGCLLLILPYFAFAENSSLNLQLPSSGNSYGQDSFRAGDLDCKNAIGGATNIEFGVTGIIDNAKGPFSSEDPLNPTEKDIGVYARIIIPLDGPKERINCNTLYELELRKKRLEILKLNEELEKLRELNQSKSFEN